MTYRYGGDIKPGDVVMIEAHRLATAEKYLQEATVTKIDDEAKTVQVERHDSGRRVFKEAKNLRFVKRAPEGWAPGPTKFA